MTKIHKKLNLEKKSWDELKENYISLCEAVIERAIADYLTVCNELCYQNPAKVSYSAHIHEYKQLLKFFNTNCNGMVSVSGKDILSYVHRHYRVNTEKISANIKEFERRWRN